MDNIIALGELPLKRLCPHCAATKLNIFTVAIVNHEVLFDTNIDDFIVINERVEESEWAYSNKASCPTCHWQGVLEDCLPKQKAS